MKLLPISTESIRAPPIFESVNFIKRLHSPLPVHACVDVYMMFTSSSQETTTYGDGAACDAAINSATCLINQAQEWPTQPQPYNIMTLTMTSTTVYTGTMVLLLCWG